MKKLAHSLPLQDMIANVLHRATEKLAAEESHDKKVKRLLAFERQEHGHIPTPEEEAEECEKRASVGDAFIEKLASACDFIAGNLGAIQFPVRSALMKAAEEGVGPGKGPGHLPVSKSIGGLQAYKKDKPKGEDAAASEHSVALTTGGLPAGKTQMQTNMEKAPGQGSGSVPSAEYPAKGPLVAGPSVKHAGVRNFYVQALTAPQIKKQASAEAIRRRVFSKMAGEDVFKAKIDGGGTVNVLAGKGQLKSTHAGQGSPPQSGDAVGGFGNQARKHIASNSAAINYTKRDAKGPVKEQLKHVLEEPALSAAHDSKLEENLRNTGKAGVKIAAAKAALRKVAQAGCQCGGQGECSYCQLRSAIAGRGSEKTANMMGGMGTGAMRPPSMTSMSGMRGAGGAAGGAMGAGGGLSTTANAGEGADGCTCGGAGECRVCKLKDALATAKSGGPVVDSGSMGEQGSMQEL